MKRMVDDNHYEDVSVQQEHGPPVGREVSLEPPSTCVHILIDIVASCLSGNAANPSVSHASTLTEIIDIGDLALKCIVACVREGLR